MATNSRIGWRPYVTQVVNAVDADATAFIAAAGITDLTQAAAISTLVNDLKTYGLWTKMKALYPFVGGSAASHKFNLKDPRDLDAAYRLVFNGGGSHTSYGYVGNSTNGYANTFIVPSTNLSTTSTHVSYYSQTDTVGGNRVEIGSAGINKVPVTLYVKYSSTTGIGYLYQPNMGNFTVSTGRRYTIISRTTNSSVLVMNNNSSTTLSQTVSGMAPTNSHIYINASSNSNTPLLGSYSDKTSSFVTIGDGLTEVECSNLYISVQKFQTTLGRHVGTPYVSDPDAIAFLNATGITDGTQAAAINTLVITMKADGTWSKMKAIYPFVGGSAVSHKFNLKDPRDLDVAYRLVFNGGWTHTSTGSLPNGTTGYADTFLTPTTSLSLDSTHISGYLRTNNAVDAPILSAENATTYNNGLYIWPKQVSFGYSVRISDNTSQSGGTNTDDIRGFHLATRTASNVKKYILNTTQKFSVTTASIALNTSNVYIAKSRNNANYFNNQIAFISIGDGLSDTEAINFYNTVQAYQTTLGRQVNVPLVSDTDAQTFLNAANITSFQQASAVNKLVVDLKTAGVWSKMKAIYPFVGGSAATHKFNLKDPRDLNAAYRLVFNGGWTHTGTGALPNGSNGYADTKFVASTSLTNNSTHFSKYNRIAESGAGTRADGVYNFTSFPNQTIIDQFYWYNGSNVAMGIGNNGQSVAYTPTNGGTGFYLSSRTSNILLKGYRDNSLIGSYTTTNAVSTLPNLPLYIGARNDAGSALYFNKYEAVFSSIGDGLTDAEASALYTAVQTYQTSLGRGVNTPIYNNGLVLSLDAGNANSYPGTGTNWLDLAAGNNGTLVNGPTYDSTNGGSILFDGIDDKLTNGTLNITGNSPITLSYFGKMITNQSGDRVMIIYGNDGTQNQTLGIYYRQSDNYIRFTAWGLEGVDYATGFLKDFGVWHKWDVVYTGTSVSIYRDGILDPNGPKNRTLNFTANRFQMGYVIGTGLYSNIQVSNVQIYNRALSSTEILSNFNSTRGRFGL